MEKRYSLIVAGSLSVILLSAFTLAIVGSEPKLPEEPYSYCPDLPNYLETKFKLVSTGAFAASDCISDDIATLGRVLFYDKMLSKDGSISCASCHKQALAFADDKRFSVGVRGHELSRNTPNINDLGWLNKNSEHLPRYFWDGRESELKEMAVLPIMHPLEMDADFAALIYRMANSNHYPALFEKAFGDRLISSERMGEALKHFIESMMVFDSKYDLVKEGKATFTDAEAKGEVVFNQHCNSCHTAPLFGLQVPLLNGFPINDIGHMAVSQNPNDRGKFRSPSLRNVAVTAPYMHDGEFGTLNRVLRFYSDSITFPQPIYSGPVGQPFVAQPMDLTSGEIAHLEAFLNTLTSPTLLTDVRWSDPFVPVEDAPAASGSDAIAIKPNPAAYSAFVDLSRMGGERFELELYNFEGKLVRRFHKEGAAFELERESLPAGVYLLKAFGNKQVATTNLVFK